MEREVINGGNSASGSRLGEPLYCPSGNRKLFGWLHRPGAGATPTVGLLICKPFGYESVCAHASIRAFAEAAAASGVPAMRFDYAGTGDSEDLDPQADQIAAWTDDILAASDELKRRTGVTKVCLLGFRLGAMLASLAASRYESATALVLIAPVINGRRYLRELRTTRLASAQRAPPAPAMGQDVTSGAADSLEVSGFSLSPATIATLSTRNLNNLSTAPASQILVIDRTDLPAAREWTNEMTKLGAQVEYKNVPGFVEMMMTQPHFSVVPDSMLAAMRVWLKRFQHSQPPGLAADDGRQESAHSVAAAAPFPLQINGAKPDDQWTERPVFFSADPGLFGIVTEPRASEPRRRGVILLNDGAAYHVGSNGMYVSLARLWAQAGYYVLRLDLSGLGDSDTRDGRQSNEVFPPAAMEDIASAISFMRDRYQLNEITVGGLCSGAYHSLRAAVAGLPINRLLMVNPMNFYWKEGMKLDDVQDAAVAALLGDRVFSARSWKRLLTGQLNIWRIVRVNLWRVWLSLESAMRDVARYLHIRMPHDLGRELEELSSRGIGVTFIFTRGEPGIDLLKLLGGSSINRLGKNFRSFIIDDGDHIFSHSGARSILMKIMSEELFRRPSQAAP